MSLGQFNSIQQIGLILPGEIHTRWCILIIVSHILPQPGKVTIVEQKFWSSANYA